MPESQNYSNHVRFDPLWHYFIAPAFLLDFIVAIAATIHDWPSHAVLHLWWVFLSIVAILAVGRARKHSLIAQDRIIRLEEKLRFAQQLPGDLQARAHALSIRQIVALRFASDEELPALVRRTLDENLDPGQIKQAIHSWRPDHFRV